MKLLCLTHKIKLLFPATAGSSTKGSALDHDSSDSTISTVDSGIRHQFGRGVDGGSTISTVYLPVWWMDSLRDLEGMDGFLDGRLLDDGME